MYRVVVGPSSVVLNMWRCKNISHIEFEFIHIFLTPPIIRKLWLQIGWVTTNNSELSLSGQYETETSSQIIFITLSSLADVRLGLRLLPASAIFAKNCWAKPASFDFSSINFNFQWSHTEHWWSCSYVVNWRCNECCKVLSVLGMSVCSMNNSLFRQGWCQRARSAYSAADEILKLEHLS